MTISDDQISDLMNFIQALEATPAENRDDAAKRYRRYRTSFDVDFLAYADRPRSEMDKAIQERSKKLKEEDADNPLAGIDFSNEAKKARKQDFSANLDICARSFARHLRTGQRPAPAYPTRIEVLLRKAKKKDLQERFTRAWDKHFGYD